MEQAGKPALANPTGTAVVYVYTMTPPPAAANGDAAAAQPANGAAEGENDAAVGSPTAAPTRAQLALPTPTYDPASWADLPVIPQLGPRALQILADGRAKGNDARVFSKIGDCESQASWFLGDFDLGASYYSLGTYQSDLAPVINFYAGSYQRLSLAARPGFSAASLMAPIWADKQQCEKGETPLACEYRKNRPAAAFILLGSNDASNPKTFEGHMRKVIEYSIAQGVLPILGTKADNVEGDHAVNISIARLGYEYGLPVWNYWRAVQGLPDHGLQGDHVHLTFGTPHFDDPNNMKNAWPVRNLNALQILKLVMDQNH